MMLWWTIGAIACMGAPGGSTVVRDSAGRPDLRSHLPAELRAKVEKVRQDRKVRQDTLAKMTPGERSQWLDSLRREAVSRRSQVLQSLSPDERERVESRMKDLEQKAIQRPRVQSPGNSKKERIEP